MTIKKLSKNKVVVFAIIASVIIIVSAIFVALYPKEIPKKVKPAKVIDDRISPLTNQGLVVEIKRVRHRGLLEKLLTPFSREWRKKPYFYVNITIDGLSFSSKDRPIVGGMGEVLYHTWDTGFNHEEFRMMRDVEEEKERSKITIRVLERVSYGLFGRKTKDIERETISLVYDYRTGRWSGDDYLFDRDGYGHYVGKYFEIWFEVYQMDYDGDGIPYWTEVNVLGTSPYEDDSKLDPDGDGIPTAWEWKWGYDPFSWDDHRHLDPDLDGLENIEEYKMERWLANPFHPDIYIEVDVMEKGSIFDIKREMFEESKQALIERFCQHGISLYIDDGWPDTPKNGGGDKVPYVEIFAQQVGLSFFYDRYFPDERKGIFRYAIIGNSGGFIIPQRFNRYDTLTVPFSWRKLIYPYFVPFPRLAERAKRVVLAQTLMHELGHSLGITPWSIEGCDNLSCFEGGKARKRYIETWANYKSVMNYYWLAGSLAMKPSHFMEFLKKTFLDYSDGSRGEYDQNDWELLYLPTFQIESTVIEEPQFEPPGKEKVVEELILPSPEGYLSLEKLDTNGYKVLKTNYLDKLPDASIYKRGFEWRIYYKEDAKPNEKNVKIYVKPKVSPTHAVWSLVAEGYMGKDGSLRFYSLEEKTNDVFRELRELKS